MLKTSLQVRDLIGLAAKSLVVALIVSTAGTASGGNWLRYPALSPDGKTIAFSFAGDLWTVPASGGRGQLLTSHSAYDFMPVWAPDGKSLAFASDRHGNLDVFLVPAAGGVAKRLTYHSADDHPSSFSADGKSVVFASHRQDTAKAAVGHTSMGELYQIALTGGRAKQLLTTPAEDARVSADGKMIAYHDYKGYEDKWRKHHVSAVARDIWVYDTAKKTHRKLTKFRGEDRNPVWSTDHKSLLFLSERGGTFNVWEMPLGKPEKATQVTKHQLHPVRFLSRANDGTIAYGFNGQIWIKAPEKEATQVKIEVVASRRDNNQQRQVLSSGATEFAVSPNNEEIAIVIRGEVFVTSVDYTTTKRITNTPQQERSVTWSPDGKTLYYAGERKGSWNLYKSSVVSADEERFASATLIKETAVLETEHETFQPVMSPDGKHLAYLHNRDEIRMLDLESGQTSMLVPAKRNYSYADGDITYDWSPDGKWLSFVYLAHKRWQEDVGVVEVATGKISVVIDSGYVENSPRWSRDGKALMFMSNRLGRRNHGSWGSDDDIFAWYLNRESWEWANRSKEELALWKKRQAKSKEQEKADKAKAEEAKAEAKKEGGDAKKTLPTVNVELKDRQRRVRRLTLHATPLGGFDLSPDGETLVYFAQVENVWDLWITRLRTRSTAKLVTLRASSGGAVEFAKDGKSVFVLDSRGGLSKVTVPAAGSGSSKSIRYSAEMNLNHAEEQAYIFEHAWRQVKRKFYKPDFHGVDWAAMKENYQQFLPSISHKRDFVELLSEMLGELNASHTGARYRPRSRGGDQTPSLGLFFDKKYNNVGLKVSEVLLRGPADSPDSKIAVGTIITHIDGVRLTPDQNPIALINNKSGKRVRLGLSYKGKDWEEVIKPISSGQERTLLYERWLRGRRELVEKRSQGKIGYVHVQGMNDPSFRRTYEEVIGRNSDKQALIVDTRYNGGGWLHDDLVSFLNGQDYLRFQPRGKELGNMGGEPAFRWSRPVAVVQSESNYSDAHMFPYAFKALKMGKLVGTPVAGTGTAVWWETQIDGIIVFGIPQVGMVTPDGKYLENLELQPDIEVYNSPESVARGEDKQLEAAVDDLLKQLKSK